MAVEISDMLDKLSSFEENLLAVLYLSHMGVRAGQNRTSWAACLHTCGMPNMSNMSNMANMSNIFQIVKLVKHA